MITFAVYHCDLSTDTLAQIREHERKTGTSSFNWKGVGSGDIARSMIDVMFKSVLLTHPDCRRVVMTDQHTELSPAGTVEVFRSAPTSVFPSLGRSEAWVQFLRQTSPGEHVIFLDYDMLVQHPLDTVFDYDFSVGLTYRSHHRWPINAGLQFVKGDRLQEGLRFYQHALDVCREQFGDWVIWCGDQWALSTMVHADFEQNRILQHHEGGYDLLLLPCDEYNYSPSSDDGWQLGTEDYAPKRVLHFKGNQKLAMFDRWGKQLAAAGRV